MQYNNASALQSSIVNADKVELLNNSNYCMVRAQMLLPTAVGMGA